MPNVISAPSRKCTAIARHLRRGSAVAAAARHQAEIRQRVEAGRDQQGDADDALHDAHRRAHDDRRADEGTDDRRGDAGDEQDRIDVLDEIR